MVTLLMFIVGIGCGAFGSRIARRSHGRRRLPEVDGVPLPDPADPRWKSVKLTFVGRRASEQCLRLGLVVVSQEGLVYVQRDNGPANPLPDCLDYGRSVWRSHDAQRALDSMVDAT